MIYNINYNKKHCNEKGANIVEKYNEIYTKNNPNENTISTYNNYHI